MPLRRSYIFVSIFTYGVTLHFFLLSLFGSIRFFWYFFLFFSYIHSSLRQCIDETNKVPLTIAYVFDPLNIFSLRGYINWHVVTFSLLFSSTIHQSVKILRHIVIDKFVIIEHDNKQYLAQVRGISHVPQEVDVPCYKSALSHVFYLASYTKMRSKLTIKWHKMIASLADQPASGCRMQLLLSKEQFNDTHSFCN